MESFNVELEARIKRKAVKIGIVGLGYVGLPLAMQFVRAGFTVLGLDIDKDRIGRIHKKESYITDVSTKELRSAVSSGKFSATGEFKALKSCSVVSICVPTPLKGKYLPNISYIQHAVKLIAGHIRKGTLIILESTTYPGTTEEVILPLFESYNLKHGRDFYLCYSPERVDPGNKHYPINKIPKVIGGLTPEATRLAAAVYSRVVVKVVPVSSARVAEAVKLLENTFRLVNIGLIDEMAMMAHKMKMDIWEIVDAAKTKPFGFMPFYPGPGVGGHCIPKDPLYLYWKAKHFGFRSRFIKLASDMINSMPGYVVSRVEEMLKRNKKKLKGSKVLVVGVTYKKDIKDLRKSPAIDVIEDLRKKGAKVSYLDPLIPYLNLRHVDLHSINPTAEACKRFDCAVIATDHSAVDYKFLLKNCALIFDARNIYKGAGCRKVDKL